MKSIDSKLLRRWILPRPWIHVSLIVVGFWCNSEMLRLWSANVLLSIIMTWTWLAFHVIWNYIKSFCSPSYPIFRWLLSHKLVIWIVRAWTWVWIRWSMFIMEWVNLWKWWSYFNLRHQGIVLSRPWVLIKQPWNYLFSDCILFQC